MRKNILLIFTVLLLASCAKTPAPQMTVNTMQDTNYPCVKIVFPNAVTYENLSKSKNGDESDLVYTLLMPSKPYYQITVTKKHTDSTSTDWALIPVSSQYDESAKVYDIPPTDENMDRTAAVAIIEKDGDLYIRAAVGEYTRPDSMYLITVDRIVQKMEFARLFSLEKWQTTASGQKFIQDMRTQADWYYSHTEVLECGYSDKMWWE